MANHQRRAAAQVRVGGRGGPDRIHWHGETGGIGCGVSESAAGTDGSAAAAGRGKGPGRPVAHSLRWILQPCSPGPSLRLSNGSHVPDESRLTQLVTKVGPAPAHLELGQLQHGRQAVRRGPPGLTGRHR